MSLGRTELRAIITHDKLYFIVPDGADSILQEVISPPPRGIHTGGRPYGRHSSLA